jgi:hypothetical protein
LKASLESLQRRGAGAHRTSARQLAGSLELMQRCLSEMREIGNPPIEFRPRDPRG